MHAGGELIANGEIVSVGKERIPLCPSLIVCVPETSGPCTWPPDWMEIAYFAYRPPWKVDLFVLISMPSLAESCPPWLCVAMIRSFLFGSHAPVWSQSLFAAFATAHRCSPEIRNVPDRNRTDWQEPSDVQAPLLPHPLYVT